MTPDIDTIGRDLKRRAAEAVQPHIDGLKSDLVRLVSEGKDYEKIARLATQLNKLDPDAFAEKISGISQPFSNEFLQALEEYGLKEMDIQYDLLPLPGQKNDNETFQQVKTETNDVDSKYIPHARAVSMTLLIQQDDDGNFIPPREIAKEIFLPDSGYASDKKALDNAASYVSVTKGEISRMILKKAGQTGSVCMAELVEITFGKNFEDLEDPSWEDFYKGVLQRYGDLSPEEFVSDIIYRGAKKNTFYNPDDIHRAAEIMLDAKLLDSKVMAEIKSLLGEVHLEGIVSKHGVKRSGSWQEAFRKAQEIHAKRRGNKKIEKGETGKAKQKVEEDLNTMATENYDLEAISTNFPAHRFLSGIIAEIKDDKQKVKKMFEILCPNTTFTVDSSGYIVSAAQVQEI